MGHNTILEFLAKKGFIVENNPNAKLTPEQFVMLAKEYASSASEKLEASSLSIGAKHPETVTIGTEAEAHRKKIEEEGRKAGLLLSSHILVGDPANRDDFDVLYLQELKNWAAFDGMSAKTEAIEEKILGPQDKQTQLLTKRVEVREVVGEKMMQELIMK